MIQISRREALRRAAWLTGGVMTSMNAVAAPPTRSRIQTVRGPIPAGRLGPTLIHEHIMCDFIGAEKTDPSRWSVDEVTRVMTPYLRQLKERGFTGFVDCTPAFIGRDPRVLKRLAEETGLHLLTNTGLYGGAGDQYVPAYAWKESASELAGRWITEWEHGIEDTGIRPGFIKTGVDEATGDPPALSEIDAKLIRAAAQASRQTGLACVCHTGGGPAGLAATRLFIQEGGAPARFIVAHSDGHGLPINNQIADLGAWVSFDAISRRPIQEHVALVKAMVKNHVGRLLLSHDNGWYSVGEKGGGEIRDYNTLHDEFLPALRREGMSEALLRRLTVENPAKAFSLSIPSGA